MPSQTTIATAGDIHKREVARVKKEKAKVEASEKRQTENPVEEGRTGNERRRGAQIARTTKNTSALGVTNPDA